MYLQFTVIFSYIVGLVYSRLFCVCDSSVAATVVGPRTPCIDSSSPHISEASENFKNIVVQRIVSELDSKLQ